MSDDPRLIKHPTDGTVAPAPGWEWCPRCDGEGSVTTVQPGPYLHESTVPCYACTDGLVAVAISVELARAMDEATTLEIRSFRDIPETPDPTALLGLRINVIYEADEDDEQEKM